MRSTIRSWGFYRIGSGRATAAVASFLWPPRDRWGVSFFLMWLVPPFGTAGLLVYYTVVYIVFDTAFTVVHIA